MSDVLFSVSEADLARLSSDEFDGVWLALGIVVRNRLSLPAAEPVAATPEPIPLQPVVPEPTVVAAPKPVALSKPKAAGRPGPRYDRDKMFAVMRRSASIADAAEELLLQRSTLNQRLDWLQAKGELPDDIRAKRPKAGKIALKADAENHPDETFNERRDRFAREAAARTWAETHPAATA